VTCLHGLLHGNGFATTNTNAITEELLETVFSVESYRSYMRKAQTEYRLRQSWKKYLCVIFDKRITWRLHIEMIKVKAFRTFIRNYFLFKSERLSAKIKLTLHKTLTRSVMTYACPAWELAADIYLLKLQRLINNFLRTIGNFPRFTSVRDLHTAFSLPYV
jgi:hypothetical protein